MPLLDALIRGLRAAGFDGLARSALQRAAARAGAGPAELERLRDYAIEAGWSAETAAASAALLAAQPDDARSLWALGVVRLQAGDLDGATQAFARCDELQSGGIASARRVRAAFMDPARGARGEPYVAELHDVLLETSFCVVFDGANAYILETQDRAFKAHPWVRARVAPDGESFVVTLGPPHGDLAEPAVLLGTDDNYSHWITRNLLRLALVEARPDLASVPLLVNEDLRSYQREFLDILGVPASRLLPVPRELLLRFRTLYVPTNVRNKPGMKAGVDWLRSRVGHLMADPSAAARRVFLSRRDSTTRVMRNEEALEAELRKLGFDVLVAGEMTVAEQIRAFSEARIVVGAHGAGLTNLVFAPPGALVFEITPTRIAHMEDFRHIAAIMGLRHVEVRCDRYPADQRPDTLEMHWDFEADVGRVLDALRASAPEVFR